MREDTKAIIESLRAVSGHAETIAQALMLGKMTAKKQREYADMLKELSELLHEHADIEEKDTSNE
ncbi:hypothetical protein OG738_32095 [Amycolatopsis sp. NBC_01488]|uniref:hypothetical protein n=1 Tax=Amycolatopsis sp. NBC_01488 TaxID=2903563 RepID=UPI002E2CD256|nr:hypothetical protein [Amycolatopsis sp. NBC_01488]